MSILCGDLVGDVTSGSSSAAASTAVLVMKSGPISLLSPFFRNCDGVLLINSANGSKEFHPRDQSGAKSLCELILELKPRRLICRFIDEPEKQKLRAVGIDVRIGSCSCPLDELVASSSALPKA